jgi:hypothetical protein
MDCFYKSCVKMDLAMLHYVTFIEPFDVLPTEVLSFDDAKFVSNYTSKVFQSKKKTMSFVSDNISLMPFFV